MSKWLLKMWLYWFGVRFYKSTLQTDRIAVVSTEFITANDCKIEFLFFRETYYDIQFRKGNFMNKNFQAFIVQAKIDNRLDLPLMRFHNSSYFFRGFWIKWVSDAVIADVLLGIYLDYLKENM